MADVVVSFQQTDLYTKRYEIERYTFGGSYVYADMWIENLTDNTVTIKVKRGSDEHTVVLSQSRWKIKYVSASATIGEHYYTMRLSTTPQMFQFIDLKSIVEVTVASESGGGLPQVHDSEHVRVTSPTSVNCDLDPVNRIYCELIQKTPKQYQIMTQIFNSVIHDTIYFDLESEYDNRIDHIHATGFATGDFKVGQPFNYEEYDMRGGGPYFAIVEKPIPIYYFKKIGNGKITIDGDETKDHVEFMEAEKWRFKSQIVDMKMVTTLYTIDGSHPSIIIECVPTVAFDYTEFLYAHPNGSDWTVLDMGVEYNLNDYQTGEDNAFYYYVKKGIGPDPEYCYFKIQKGSGAILINDVETHFWGFDYPTSAWKYIVATSSGNALLTFSYDHEGTTKTVKVELLSRQGSAKVIVERCSKDGIWSQITDGNTYELNDVLMNSADGGIRFSLEYEPPAPVETVGTYPIIFYKSDGQNILYRDLGNDQRTFNWNKEYVDSEGHKLKPIDHDWQKYQTSYFIKRNTAISMELNQTANIFYEIGIQPSVNDEMRMIIACAQFGELDLGCIQSISDGYTAKLSAIPIVAYGFSNAFCMDLGTGREITVQYKRSQPIDFNDRSTDSRDWSNAKWQAQLKALMNRWQMRTNGVRLYQFVPKDGKSGIADLGDMTDCYPAINPAYPPGERETYENWVNAYIISIGNGYAPSKLNVIEDSITFKIGTIYPKPIPYMTVAVTFMLEDKPQYKTTIYYPANSTAPMPYCPSELLKGIGDEVFIGWYIDGETPRKEYNPGDKFNIPNSNMTVYAIYTHEGVRKFFEDTPVKFIKPSELRLGSTYVIHAIGGGGGGGGCSANDTVPEALTTRAGGGGGESGEHTSKTVSSIDDGTGKVKYGFLIEIGVGGKAGIDAPDHSHESQGNGGHGGTTHIYWCDESGNKVASEPELLSASGGDGGKCHYTGGGAGGKSEPSLGRSAGGEGGYAGTVWNPLPHMVTNGGGSGKCEPGCAHPGNGGKGVGSGIAVVAPNVGGGGGGGAPYIVSNVDGAGGNGFSATGDTSKGWTIVDSTPGRCGGGGGGGGDHKLTEKWMGKNSGASAGGSGYVVIAGRFNE